MKVTENIFPLIVLPQLFYEKEGRGGGTVVGGRGGGAVLGGRGGGAVVGGRGEGVEYTFRELI